MENSLIQIGINALKNSTNDKKYSLFLDRLNTKEQEHFLFIEVQRANTFLEDLSESKGNRLSIADLQKPENKEKIKGIITNDIYIQNLISFWNSYGKIEKTESNVIKSIIDKYEKHYKKLSDVEKQFLENLM